MSGNRLTALNKSDPSNGKEIRVLKKTLVFVMGFPSAFKQLGQKLKSKQFFGNYGKVLQVSLSEERYKSL